MLEMAAQNLKAAPESVIIFFNCKGNFDLHRFSDICESYLTPNDSNKFLASMLDRFKVIDIFTSAQFNEYLHTMSSLIMLYPTLSMIIVDELVYYYYNSYVVKRAARKTLHRAEFVAKHSHFFWHIAKKYAITIFYTLPDYLDLNFEDKAQDWFLSEWKTVRNRFAQRQKGGCGENVPEHEPQFDETKMPDLSQFMKPDVQIKMNRMEGQQSIYTMHVSKESDRIESDISFKIGDMGIEWM
jgi:hypothetical protein